MMVSDDDVATGAHADTESGNAKSAPRTSEHTARWPRRVYRDGEEPDPRFTLANERTYLAWLRTALALMAGGVGIKALDASEPPGGHALRLALALALLLAGLVTSAIAFSRWMSTEKALRTKRPLPAPRLAPVLGYGLATIGGAACILLLTARG